MVKMSIEHGICNISAFAFACYGALLINEPCYDIEGGHMMGRVATEMTAKLGADEVCGSSCPMNDAWHWVLTCCHYVIDDTTVVCKCVWIDQYL